MQGDIMADLICVNRAKIKEYVLRKQKFVLIIEDDDFSQFMTDIATSCSNELKMFTELICEKEIYKLKYVPDNVVQIDSDAYKALIKGDYRI